MIGVVLLCVPSRLAGHEGTHEALERNTRKIAAEPDSPGLRLDRADLLLDHGEATAAITAIDQAAAHGASADACAILRAKAWMLSDKPQAAVSELDTVLHAHPDHLPALTLRTRAHVAAGEPGPALADARRTLELHSDPDMAFLAADLLIATGKTQAAIELLDSLFPVERRPASIQQRALEIEIASAHWDAALARLNQEIAITSRPEPRLARKAEVLTMAGRTDEALATWQELDQRLANLPPAIGNSHAMQYLANEVLSHLNPVGSP